MKHLVRVQLADSEIAIVQLSNDEHNALHKNAKEFVNTNNVFVPPAVNSVKVEPHAQPQAKVAASATWTATIRHWPGCNCSAACVSDVQ